MFFFYWFSFQFGYLLTLITAVPFGLFSSLQLVISMEQSIRYLNRVHPEKILLGTSFYLMVMQLLRQTFKISVEQYSASKKSTIFHYIPCILVEGLILLTAFSAVILNKWLYAERVDLDKPHHKAQLLANSEHAEPKADATYNAEIEMEIY